MKQFTIKKSDLKFGDRLVPTFYYYTKVVINEYVKKGVRYACLGDHCNVSDGEHSHISRNDKSGIRYLYGRNIKEGVINFDPISDDSFITESDYDDNKRCHINENDVLIAIYGTIGKSAVYKSKYVGVAGIPRHISNITVKEKAGFTPEYLSSYFRSRAGKWQLFSVTTGNIQQLLSLKNIRALDIPIAGDSFIDEITKIERNAINHEIKALENIEIAKDLLYNNLNFGIKDITRDFSFTVNSEELFYTNYWSTSFYDKLYIKVADELVCNNGALQLGKIASVQNGDEVGSINYNEFIHRHNEDKSFIRTSDIVNYEMDLYPDYYIEAEVSNEIVQDIQPRDIVFTKDGKIASVGMITDEDNVIISSGIARLRLKQDAIDLGWTQEYLFIALSIPEIGRYAAIRRTVIASTIPHLREARLKEIEIPIIEKKYVDEITKLVEEAFRLKGKRKKLLKQSNNMFEEYFNLT